RHFNIYPVNEKRPQLVPRAFHPCARGATSAAQTQARDQVDIALLVLALEIVQQLAALCDHHQKATARVVVLLVGLEMLGQRRDARAEDCHLNLGRTGVAFLGGVFAHDAGFFFDGDRHRGLLNKRVMAQAGMSSSAGPWSGPPDSVGPDRARIGQAGAKGKPDQPYAGGWTSGAATSAT